jgi:hypothetical protein
MAPANKKMNFRFQLKYGKQIHGSPQIKHIFQIDKSVI